MPRPPLYNLYHIIFEHIIFDILLLIYCFPTAAKTYSQRCLSALCLTIPPP